MKTTILVFLAWLVLRISRAKASPTSMETLLNFIDKHLEVESSSFLENELLPQEVALLQLLAQTIQNDQGPLRRDVGTSDNFLEIGTNDTVNKSSTQWDKVGGDGFQKDPPKRFVQIVKKSARDVVQKLNEKKSSKFPESHKQRDIDSILSLWSNHLVSREPRTTWKNSTEVRNYRPSSDSLQHEIQKIQRSMNDLVNLKGNPRPSDNNQEFPTSSSNRVNMSSQLAKALAKMILDEIRHLIFTDENSNVDSIFNQEDEIPPKMMTNETKRNITQPLFRICSHTNKSQENLNKNSTIFSNDVQDSPKSKRESIPKSHHENSTSFETSEWIPSPSVATTTSFYQLNQDQLGIPTTVLIGSSAAGKKTIVSHSTSKLSKPDLKNYSPSRNVLVGVTQPRSKNGLKTRFRNTFWAAPNSQYQGSYIYRSILWLPFRRYKIRRQAHKSKPKRNYHQKIF